MKIIEPDGTSSITGPAPVARCFCGRVEDVRMVNYRAKHGTNKWQEHKTPLCGLCRQAQKGQWSYARHRPRSY